MKTGAAFFAMGALLAGGISIGALGMHLFDHFRLLHQQPARIAVEPFHLDQLAEMLELSPDQRRQLELLLLESHDEARRLHEEILPRVRHYIDEMHGRIAAILDDEQRERLDDIHAHHRAALEHLFLRHSRRLHD